MSNLKIKVSAKNEKVFVPEIFGNKSKPEADQFRIILRKPSSTIHSTSWYEYEKVDGSYRSTNFRAAQWLRSHIVRFENAPILETGDGEEELTPEILLSETYEELFPLLSAVSAEVGLLQSEKPDEKK